MSHPELLIPLATPSLSKGLPNGIKFGMTHKGRSSMHVVVP
jgi:hypothetical protein